MLGDDPECGRRSPLGAGSVSDGRHTRGGRGGSEPDPYRRAIVVLGIALGLLAFAVMGYALWSDGTMTAGDDDTNATNETIDTDRVEEGNETEPAENASGDGGGENAGNAQADEDETSGADGDGNESNESAEPEPEPPEEEPTGNGTNENGTNGTNETETNGTGTANETNA